jgi:hypothetical protein
MNTAAFLVFCLTAYADEGTETETGRLARDPWLIRRLETCRTCRGPDCSLSWCRSPRRTAAICACERLSFAPTPVRTLGGRCRSLRPLPDTLKESEAAVGQADRLRPGRDLPQGFGQSADHKLPGAREFDVPDPFKIGASLPGAS